MTSAIVACVAFAVMAGLVGWELGHRQGHKHEKEYVKKRWAQVLTILHRLDPEAYEAVEVAAYMLEEEDRDLSDLERIGKL